MYKEEKKFENNREVGGNKTSLILQHISPKTLELFCVHELCQWGDQYWLCGGGSGLCASGWVGQDAAQHGQGLWGHQRLAVPVQSTQAWQVAHPTAQAAHFRQQVLQVISADFSLKPLWECQHSTSKPNLSCSRKGKMGLDGHTPTV